MATAAKEIHFTMGTHLDLFWMGAPRDCLDRGTEIILEALELCRKHKEYCYYIESVVFAEYLLGRHPEMKDLMLDLIKKGKLEIGGAYADRVEHSHEGESILRHHVYAARWLKKTFGIHPRSTCHSDLPGLSPQIPQILAKCGIDYYVRARGVCAVYNWEAPDGSTILYSCVGANYGQKSLKDMEGVLAGASAFPPKVITRGGYGDLQMANDGIIALLKELREKYPQYRFFISSPSDVLDYYKGSAAERKALPRIKGEWPYGWGNGGSMEVVNYQLITLLENQLLTAEKVTAVGKTLGIALRPPSARAMWWCSLFRYAREGEPPLISEGSELQEAWKVEMFVQDHNYSGFSGNKSDQDRQVMLKYGSAYVQGIIGHALTDLGGAIEKPAFPGSERIGARIVVFNPLSWPRDELVKVTLPDALAAASVKLVDESGKIQDFQRAASELAFTARAVPSIGFRPYYVLAVPPEEVYQKEPPSPIYVMEGHDLRDWHREFVRWQRNLPDYGEPWLVEIREGDTVRLETEFYRVRLAEKNGYLRSLYVKKIGKELALGDGSRCFGELVSYEDPGIDVRYCFTGNYTRDSESAYTLRKVSGGPVSATFAFEGTFNYARVEKLITLYRDLPYIDLEVVIYWWGEHGTHVRFCLPFSGEGFTETWYGVPYHQMKWPLMMEGVEESVILGMEEKNTDELRSEDRQHFREVVKWVDVGYRDCGVTLAVRLPNMWIDHHKLEVPLVRGNRSCGDHNVWADNSGRRAWEFRILPHAGDWQKGKAFRTGWDLNNPLIAQGAAGPGDGRLRATPTSFFRPEQDNVVVSVVKLADDGSGDIVLRYYEAEGKSGTVAIECFRPVKEAHEADLLESPSKRLETRGSRIEAPTVPYEIKTIRFKL